MNLTISRCPRPIRHDFPDEMMNYIDEKMDEGQYKKRFRYDRPEKQSRSTAARQQKTILNMNSQDIFEKIVNTKKEAKEDRFFIKPRKKLNTDALHSALLKVKRQKEILDQQLEIADKTKQANNENDICMLANQGAINYIMKQNIEFDEKVLIKSRRIAHSAPRVKKRTEYQQIEEPINPLAVEGHSYNLTVSQLFKMRPTSSNRTQSAFSTMRPASSTKNYSDKGISEQLLSQYADLRNQLFEMVQENQDEDSEAQVEVGYPNYLTPSQSSLGFRGGKVPPGFMPKGLKRIHCAATTNVDLRTFAPGEMFQYDTLPVPKRPQTAILSKVQSTSRLPNDHLRVIDEIKHQEDLSQIKQSFNESIKEQHSTLQVQGNNKRVQSAHPFKLR